MDLRVMPTAPLTSTPGEGGLQKTTLTYWVLMGVFALAGAIFVLALVYAVGWIARPFPGFVVEQTSVIAGMNGEGWNGRAAGLAYPQRVTHINGLQVTNDGGFEAAMADLAPGQRIQVRTQLPDGSTRSYDSVELQAFPPLDFARLFWLPYGIGLAYLLLGIWVFRARGHTPPGRAFAYFCASAAIINALLFDLVTTHAMSMIWTVAIAQLGGALIRLSSFFPIEWQPRRKLHAIRFAPYLASLGLSLWGLLVLKDELNPWAYVEAWRGSYIYAALGILIFLAMMVYRFLTSPSAIAKQQVRIILGGSLISFLPVGIWLGAPLFGVLIGWNPAVFLPLLIIFPLTIAIAIQRYRLMDIDFIVNRTVVYGLLSASLIVIYLTSVMVFEWFFRRLTGEDSPLTIAFSTLAIAMSFHPLRMRIQDFIDRRFYRRRYNANQALAAFSAQIRDETNLDQLSAQVRALIEDTIQPEHVRVWFYGADVDSANKDETSAPIAQITEMLDICPDDPLVRHLQKNPESVTINRLELESPLLASLRALGVQVCVPLTSHGELVGLIMLGSRLSEQDYSIDDFRLLNMLAVQTAPAVRVAQMVRHQQAETLARQRLDHELQIARVIQQTLVPLNPPTIPGWLIESHYQPAREVGGDFYDFIHFPDGRLGILIGDVTDKGIPAALVMASTRSLLRSTAFRLVSPGEVLREVNQLLVGDVPEKMFVTCLYALLEPATGRIQYANAGHPPPFRRTSHNVSELYITGMPLGLMPEMSYEQHETTLLPNECLLFFSDGLVEAHDSQREMFGESRLVALLEKQRPEKSGMLKSVLDELADFTGPAWEQEDDVTLLALHRRAKTV